MKSLCYTGNLFSYFYLLRTKVYSLAVYFQSSVAKFFLTSSNINYLILSTLLEEENSQTDNIHAYYCKER